MTRLSTKESLWCLFLAAMALAVFVDSIGDLIRYYSATDVAAAATAPASHQHMPGDADVKNEFEEEITYAELPEAVRVAFADLADVSAIAEIEREREHGRWTYDIEFVDAGIVHEAEFAPDGELLELEQEDEDD